MAGKNTEKQQAAGIELANENEK